MKKEDNKDDDEEQGDGNKEARVRIEKLPDDSYVLEPHYMQPYAETAAVTVAEKTLDFIPPSHSHAHNYIISLDDSFPIVVREAQSAGSSMEDERTKSMTGILRVLNAYNHAIDVILGTRNCEIGFHKISTQRGSRGLTYPVNSTKRLEMKCPAAEDEYTKFIMKMIDALECVLGFWVNKYYGRTCAIKPGTYPTLIPDGEEFKNP